MPEYNESVSEHAALKYLKAFSVQYFPYWVH